MGNLGLKRAEAIPAGVKRTFFATFFENSMILLFARLFISKDPLLQQRVLGEMAEWPKASDF